MSSIVLTRSSSDYDPQLSGYRMQVSVSSADTITTKIFCKKRIRNFFTNEFDDYVVAICTVAQLEDFCADCPCEGDSYFRTDSVCVTKRTSTELDDWFTSASLQVLKLVNDFDAAATLAGTGTFTITDAGIVQS